MPFNQLACYVISSISLVAALLALLAATAVGFYYVFLAMVALVSRRTSVSGLLQSAHRFVILIPAHNEEAGIARTLQSCQALDYPPDKFEIVVIADNSTDRTIEIARQYGVVCLERHSEDQRGKGHALAWALQRIHDKSYDGLLVLDADCTISKNALQVFSACFLQGQEVLQANDVASNPDATAISYAVAVGNMIENDLFYAPKSHLGLCVFLRGTGMVFSRRILEEFPWHALSAAEDVEYSLTLIRHGIRIRFLPQVCVASEFPVNSGELSIQRKRWAGGNLRLSRKHGFRLMLNGVRQRRPLLFDAGLTFLVLSRPLVLAMLALGIFFSGLALLTGGDTWATVLLGWGLGLTALFGFYFLLGIVCLGMTRHRLFLLVSAPLVVIRLLVISITGLFAGDHRTWTRSPRARAASEMTKRR